MPREASCLWSVTPELIRAIDDRLGPPVDSYVNGSQTWFTDEPELGDITVEWRLHPVAGFEPVPGITPDDRWDAVVAAAATLERATSPMRVGNDERTLASIWDGLECYVAYGDECEPAPLAHAATERLGIAPDASGLVDHDAIGDAWERERGAISVADLLRAQFEA